MPVPTCCPLSSWCKGCSLCSSIPEGARCYSRRPQPTTRQETRVQKVGSYTLECWLRVSVLWQQTVSTPASSQPVYILGRWLCFCRRPRERCPHAAPVSGCTTPVRSHHSRRCDTSAFCCACLSPVRCTWHSAHFPPAGLLTVSCTATAGTRQAFAIMHPGVEDPAGADRLVQQILHALPPLP